MGVPDPPWLIKTRPCPFFQQGRCIFDHKCNFVHSIRSPLTIRVPLGYELDITLSDLASPSPSPAGQFLQPHAVSRQASPPTKPADTPRTSASDASAPFRPKAAKPILGTASFRAALEEKLRVRQGLIYKHVSQPPSPPDLEPEEEFTFEHIETPTTPPEHNEEFEPTFNNIITSSTPNRYGQQSSFSPEFSSIHSPDVRDVDTELSDPTLTYKSPAVFTRHNPSAPPSPSTQVPLSNAGSPIPFSYDVPIRRSLEHSPTLSTVRAPIHSLPENDFRQSLGHPLSPDDLEPNDEPLSDDEDEDDVTARIATVKGPLRILSPPRIQSSPVSPASRDIEVYEADMAINPFQPSPQLSPQLSPQHSPQPSPRQSLRQSPQYTLRHSLQHSPEHSPQQVRRAESIDLLEETAPAEGFFKVDENFTTLSPRHSDASLSSDGSEDDQSHPPASYQIEAFETQKNIVVSPPPPPPPENPEPTMSTRPWLKQLRLLI
ncbi:hypothetical protein SISSUDRAFT_250787 [Sistotremastrum suecicum HHB10207 ss-3]|uniref:C3H1-type domain-containing protein n=1 Tax=Sistotremastrum suecicum HHB10207 ss-3 TaxID=1314776 RepID=A0A165ZWU6_9AGAM|nr:hypothetical protein SISSUDRAFT_250787 [Sistotremastrum suecicum HHB10207 ss-3]